MADTFDRAAFERLRQQLAQKAKPSLTPDQIDAAIEGARSRSGPQPAAVKIAAPRLAKGFGGEARREQFVQDSGEISLTDKLSFNQVNQGGIDGATLGLNDRGVPVLFLDDNKAFSRAGVVRRASALQQNFEQNLQKLVRSWRGAAADTTRSEPERRLFKTAADLADARHFQKRVANAGGKSVGTSIPDATLLDVEGQHGKVAATKAGATKAAGGGPAATTQRSPPARPAFGAAGANLRMRPPGTAGATSPAFGPATAIRTPPPPAFGQAAASGGPALKPVSAVAPPTPAPPAAPPGIVPWKIR